MPITHVLDENYSSSARHWPCTDDTAVVNHGGETVEYTVYRLDDSHVVLVKDGYMPIIAKTLCFFNEKQAKTHTDWVFVKITQSEPIN